MTTRRFAILMALVAMPMVLLLIDPSAYARLLVPVALIVLALTTWLLYGLIRAREETQRVDDILSATSAAFTAAESRTEAFKAARDAFVDLIGKADDEAVATLVMIENNTWKPVATTLSAADSMRGQWRIQTILQTIRESGDSAETSLRARHQLTITDRSVLYVPLVSLNEVCGAAIVETASRLPQVVVESFEKLAVNLALALMAADLSTDLQRQRGEKRYRALIENSGDAIFILDKAGRTMFASSAAERILAASGQPSVFQAIHPKDRAAFVSMVQNAAQALQALERHQSLECRVLTNGEPRWLDVSATDLTRDADVEGVVLNARDITEKKLLERDLRHRVLHDELTGISNRALLRERVDHALTLRRADDSVAALLFIDLIDFKAINETLGRDAGDELLKVIAFRIDNFVRGHDTAARFDADKFAVLLQDVATQADIEKVAARLHKVVQMPLELNGRQISPKARIGVCLAQPDYDSGVFLRNAQVALNEAKITPGHVTYFSESMSVSAVERMDLRRELEHAVEHDELTAHYQPLIDLQNGTLAGFEALICWEHPSRGLVSPASFIPLAEETGLIVPIGAWVLHQACRQLVTWRGRRPDLNLKMSINVSFQQLKDEGFVNTVARIIDETGTPAEALILELTETDHLREPAIRERLSQLRTLGVGLAADDFGSGFASYTALQELPFTVAKIDRTLTAALSTNFQKTSTQLRNVIEMAHNAGLLVAAEGIEDIEQCNHLTALGCNIGQGYFFGRPAPAAEADEVVTRSPSLQPTKN